MDIKTLSLLVLRAISLLGIAVSFILLSFSEQLLQSHGISMANQSLASTILLLVAFAVPVVLWFSSPLIIARVATATTNNQSNLDAQDIIPLILIITGVSFVSRGVVEIAVSFLSTLTLDTVPNAVLVVNLDDSSSFGLSGITQVAFGALLLWLTPLLSNALIRSSFNRTRLATHKQSLR